MKTKLYLFLLIMASAVCFSSCSKEDSFAYPMSQLYGKWKATELLVGGKWYNVTKYPYTKFGMSITFYEGGTFYGTGYLGTGSGTYKTKGDNQIVTYVDGDEYATYTVNSLSDNNADLTLTMGSESLRMKAEKQ